LWIQSHGVQGQLSGALSVFAGSAEIAGIERGLRRLQILPGLGEIRGDGFAGERLLGRGDSLAGVAHLLHRSAGTGEEQQQGRETQGRSRALKQLVVSIRQT